MQRKDNMRFSSVFCSRGLKALFLLAILLISPFYILHAQDEVDSLKKMLAAAKTDSARMREMIELTEILETDEMYMYCNQSQLLAEKLIEKSKGKAIQKFYYYCLSEIHFNYAHYLIDKDHILETIPRLEKAERAVKFTDSLSQKARISGLFSFVYSELGDLKKAINASYEQLNILEQMKDSSLLVACLINSAGLFNEAGMVEKQEQSLMRAVQLAKNNNAKRDQWFTAVNNMANFYSEKGYLEKGLRLYEEALRICDPAQYKNLALAYHNIASVNLKLGGEKIKVALEYYQKSVEAAEKSQNPGVMMNVLCGLASFYHGQKEYAKACNIIDDAGQLLTENSPIKSKRRYYSLQAKFSESCGDYDKALESFELYIKLNDSLKNESNKKAGISSQMQYDYEKKAEADSLKQAGLISITNTQIASRKKQSNVAIVILIVILGFLVFMISRFRITSRQKKLIETKIQELETQRHVIEEKQQEILDSIHYAKRIQTALITNEKYIEKSLRKLNG